MPPSSASGPGYLALGDSAPVYDGSASYPDRIAAHYKKALSGLELENLAHSGATTTSMLNEPVAGDSSQQQQAVDFVKAHRGSVALVTIDIGGNDVFACVDGSAASAASGGR